jgi:hypothetical protein
VSHQRLLTFVLLAICVTPGRTEASFGPGEAAARSSSRPAGQRVAQHADFKVAVWYRKKDPLGTFKYQIYDVQKGEYTAKVDEWAKDVQTKYPGYYVVVRDVDLTREKGETDMLKVGSVIDRELTVAASFAGIDYRPGRRSEHDPFFGLGAGRQSTTTNRAPGLIQSPSRDRDYLTPNPTPFPVPVPYPHLPR